MYTPRRHHEPLVITDLTHPSPSLAPPVSCAVSLYLSFVEYTLALEVVRVLLPQYRFQVYKRASNFGIPTQTRPSVIMDKLIKKLRGTAGHSRPLVMHSVSLISLRVAEPPCLPFSVPPFFSLLSVLPLSISLLRPLSFIQSS